MSDQHTSHDAVTPAADETPIDVPAGVIPGGHTGAPEDNPEHNTAHDGLPGGALS
ncbi:hypothetical protein [Microbacterium sp. YJN-G]|uniref:hypothetical protein n=1 Tax=Microbacterium sp. YJN-G TaxID=2763257 RepID=UPI001878E527|nr:hypothetical protein [Microbacterium sp. YJN-G]